MTVWRKKNVVELQVPMKDIIRMEVVDAREYLFEVEMRNIDIEAASLLNFISEIARIDRLVKEQCRGLVKRRRDSGERDCTP